MSKAMKVIEGDVTNNGEPKAKRKTEIAIAAPPTADAWLQTMKDLAPVVGIEGLRELMTMRREEQGRLAEREFNAAMALAQNELIPVIKNRSNTQTKSKYADMAAIAEAAMPTIHKHGFGLSFSEFRSDKPDHLGVTCEATHAGGHGKRYEFHVPMDGAGLKGNANKTATHAYGSSFTYGRRYATCGVFNIATKDDDGNAASAPDALVTEEQIATIRAKITEYEGDEGRFCDFLNVDGLADLPAKQYEGALLVLDAKRRAKK